MDCFEVIGGTPLRGEVGVAGSKNGTLPLMAAALLSNEASILSGIPGLRDIHTLADLLSSLGLETHFEAQTLRLEPSGQNLWEAPYDLVRRMRASVCVLGPLLARTGHASVPLPGGCVLGVRPIDLHLRGMEALGASVELTEGCVLATAPSGGLPGGSVDLSGPRGSTVLGTANVLMAATLARGESVLHGAACEPEIAVLVDFLNAAGARIEGRGTSVLRIQGVTSLAGLHGRVPADRIEAGTLLLAAAMTRGTVRLTNCPVSQLTALLDSMEAAGVPLTRGENWASVEAQNATFRNRVIQTAPYPGYATDLQAQWMAFATQAEGTTFIREGIYPERFLHAAELVRLGAKIEVANGSARVFGPTPLSGAPVIASDLRASAALVMAGLVAEGKTVVRRVYHLDRGYERLEEKLSSLGAKVRRVVDEMGP